MGRGALAAAAAMGNAHRLREAMRAFRSALLLENPPSFFAPALEFLFPSSGVFAALLILLATPLNLILLVPPFPLRSDLRAQDVDQLVRGQVYQLR